jgi:hypothetical protein
MSLLSYRCPNTSKEVTTGIDSDAAGLAKLRNMKVAVNCPHCQDGHVVTADSMFFSFELSASTPAYMVPELDR